jgi:beta-lactam-binding protein with PASTA domain
MSSLRRQTWRRFRFLAALVKVAAICAGLMALGLTSAYVAMEWVMDKDRVEVPRVGGLDSIAAGALVREAGLVPRVAAEEFSSRVPKGRVTSQRPPGGTRTKLGARRCSSAGERSARGPQARGRTLPKAQRTLAEAGLTLGPVTRFTRCPRPRRHHRPGPPAGRRHPRSLVKILQSLGPWEEIVTMPDLRGRDMVAALNLLRELQVEAR